jgi:hypothetical protein
MGDLASHPFSPLVLVPAFAVAGVAVGLAIRSKRLPDTERRVWRHRLLGVTLALWLAGIHATAWLVVVALAGPATDPIALAAAIHLAFWFTVAAAVAAVATEAATRSREGSPVTSALEEYDQSDQDYDPSGVFAPSLRGRLIMVASTSFCFLIGFIPEPWFYFSEWGHWAALIGALMIFANYVFDGRPGPISRIRGQGSQSTGRPNPRLHADETLDEVASSEHLR